MRTIAYLTLDEATMKLKQALNVDEVILEESGCGRAPYIESVMRVTRLLFPKTYLTNDKIAAIKKLRELVAGLGLAEAKAAVERPDEAIAFYLKHGKPLGL